MSHWTQTINNKATMKITSTFGKVAVALCAVLLLVTGADADSDKLTKREFKFIPVSLPSEEHSDQSTTLSLDEVSASNRKPYYLRSGDELLLVLTNPGYEFENSVTIDNQGTVNLTHLGWVNLENKTVEQAEILLRAAYADKFFKNPRISLRLVKKAPLRFKILGQVAQPGFYEVPPGLEVDLLDAIAIAGGYTRLANKVTYKYLTQEKKDAPAEERIEVYRIRELKRTSNSKIPVLNGDDTIVVGESIF
jgi:polysaccharide export outer membrane protein